ncbi:uncharacterized protein LOC126752193 isoform X2 [Bactrocera neohumeralis]|uniref:uncharacterized protein LOC126752193 isoform X2 n=1 Tax=Bactrocera neohumeralis TaxID=98809 RepID=UPI002166000E|nr:uncharacterized protein LOC126752193 isoform X2 [Bactrocera neohumeralis]
MIGSSHSISQYALQLKFYCIETIQSVSEAEIMSRRRKCNKLVESENESVDEFSDEEHYNDVLKTAGAQNLFNNPVMAFLATLSSIIFWCIYWLAKALIVFAGIFMIITFIFPHKIVGLLNRFLDQQKVEQYFKDEL